MRRKSTLILYLTPNICVALTCDTQVGCTYIAQTFTKCRMPTSVSSQKCLYFCLSFVSQGHFSKFTVQQKCFWAFKSDFDVQVHPIKTSLEFLALDPVHQWHSQLLKQDQQISCWHLLRLSDEHCDKCKFALLNLSQLQIHTRRNQKLLLSKINRSHLTANQDLFFW